MEFNLKLLKALQKDNVKEFKSCMDESNCGTLRLGRFPVLSVMYMYKCRRLLRIYEKTFLRYNSWRDVGEPLDLAAKFRAVAGKCLRLYLNETVSPIEMLLLLDRNLKVKKVFPQLRVVPPVKQRLKEIYYIRWGLSAEFVRDTIVLDRRPLTRAEKLHWATCAMCVALCVAIFVSTPFVVNVFQPFIADGQGVIHVSRWQQINFASDKTYALKQDVTAPSNFFAEEVNCTLYGNGHTVTVTGNGLFGKLNGTLSDVVFNTNGQTLVDTVQLKLSKDKKTVLDSVSNVTVNAAVNMQVDKSCAFFANNNYGLINKVTLNVNGSLSATVTDDTDQFRCGGIVGTNYATLADCTANYNNFTLAGQLTADASFGGIVGLNEWVVRGCVTSGAIFANTFDLAGICAENNYGILDCTNTANLTQQTNDFGWSPIAAGIVIINNYGVETCVNTGAISCALDAELSADIEGPSVEAAGIMGRAYGYASGCLNTGTILATSTGNAHVGGIAASSCIWIAQCMSTGKLQVTGSVCYVGGILGYAFGATDTAGNLFFSSVQQCVSGGELKVTLNDVSGSFAAVGGVVGYMEEKVATNGAYQSGKITQCYFTGALQTPAGAYVGAVAGVVGNNVYLASSPNNENSNFYANAYLDGCGASLAFGAALQNDSYQTVADVGATVATVESLADDTTYQKLLQMFETTA